MPTRREKLNALADKCEATLNAVKSGLNVQRRFRKPATPHSARADRVAVMGDPVYYLEIHPSGSGVPEESATGIAKLVDHVYRVWLYYQYTDDDSHARSSQDTWDKLVEDAPNGLLPTLRAENKLTAGGQPVTMFSPQNDEDDVVPLSNRGQEDAHSLTFEITVRHVR